MIWTLSLATQRCGQCGVTIPAETPYAVATTRKLKRCEVCAGEPVNVSEVEAARWSIEQRQLPLAPETVNVIPHGPGFTKASLAGRDVPFLSSQAFDAKMAAAHDLEDDHETD